MDLLKALIKVSEKAANIARICRKDEHLFELLVQKKKSDEANPRFVEDFKTLADVLIQEMVKHDIENQFQELSDCIRGEENAMFKNKLGEHIYVEVKATEEETSALLEKVLNGDRVAADLLAAQVHRDIEFEAICTEVPEDDFDVNLEELGIWIDPIDCTGEYIHGGAGYFDHNIYTSGLNCVTILIGAFNKNTGTPVIGVVNRPFLDEEVNGYSQRCIWGVALPNHNVSSLPNQQGKTKVICISSSERVELKETLKERGFHLIEASGAGYKILTVILGLADAYVLTKGTTFKWDTCAPHSILKALGGDIVDLKESLTFGSKPIRYSIDGSNCNCNGIIAYRNEDILNEIVEILKK